LYGRKDLLDKIKRKVVPSKKNKEERLTPPQLDSPSFTFPPDMLSPVDTSPVAMDDLSENTRLTTQVSILEKSLSSLTEHINLMSTQFSKLNSDFAMYKRWAHSQQEASSVFAKVVLDECQKGHLGPHKDKIQAAYEAFEKSRHLLNASRPPTELIPPSLNFTTFEQLGFLPDAPTIKNGSPSTNQQVALRQPESTE
jgi:hypothetical protein